MLNYHEYSVHVYYTAMNVVHLVKLVLKYFLRIFLEAVKFLRAVFHIDYKNFHHKK